MSRRWNRVAITTIGAVLILAGLVWLRSTDKPLQPQDEAAHCTADLARRSPELDAANDLARGDPTPIGITFRSDDDPSDAATRFDQACPHGYAGPYRPTGKWFKSIARSTFYPDAPGDHDNCRRAADNYIARYNKEMARLAPDAVTAYCQSMKLSTQHRLGTASVAVLGTAQAKREIINGATYRTEASWVIDTRHGPVLVTTSYRPDSPAYCLDCRVGVGIAYLDEVGSRISLRRRWPLVWTTASKRDGEGFSTGLSLNDMLTSYPALGVGEGRSLGGRKCGWDALLELRPEGPVDRGVIRRSFYAKGSEGRWKSRMLLRFENVDRDHSFDAVISSEPTEHYEMRNGRFVGPENSVLKC